MASLTLTIALPPNQYHSSAKTLLGLPLELRNQIYHAALVTPAKHYLQHNPDCHFRHGHTRTSIEPAASMVLDPTVEIAEPMLYPWDLPSDCRCAKRTMLNLLLACRQIHREAAPIFWRHNTFVFESSDEFTICVGSRLRESYRKMLRSVYIASPQPAETAVKTSFNLFTQEHVWQPIQRWCQFWGVLNQCAGMRDLAIRPEVVRKHATDLGRLKTRMPGLRRLELTYVGTFKDRSVLYDRHWGSFRGCTTIHRETVFVRAAQEVDLGSLDGSAKSAKELHRGFTTNFCVYVGRIARERFLGCEDAEELDLHSGAVSAELNDRNSEFEVELPDGKTARLYFMGVPQSKETRVALARRSMARDWKLRKEGKASAAEEKVLEEMRQKRVLRKEQVVDDEARERERVLDERRYRAHEMRDAERKEKRAEKAEIRRAAEVAKEERRMGRKRIVREEVVEDVKAVVDVKEVVEEVSQAAPKTPRKVVVKKEVKWAGKKKGMGRRKGMSEIEEDLRDMSWDSSPWDSALDADTW
ncbi:hypothetical protein CkaCkLH20_04325 [Colletotrichum karsti]|uniref:DUF7730 domain-containing protein n=1 Tax=Colletotrichum karsti TaxID=1095194 RepID=A0A9P6I9L0_9PEZI|nr:uncharacterized protein CkaCkLH20_04325 [Colletotrichum karsti]KAF9878287.1 hypothetical protein CkaCkLH20_04325 [Colletotrichum karsti]